MGPKYEFTDETTTYDGHVLHRIRRLSDGKTGGWLEKEENLSQEGSCWVDGDARVFGNAKVYDNAKVYNKAWVYDNARVCVNAQVFGEAWVYGNARVCGDTQVYGNAKVYDKAWVYDNARVCVNAQVFGEADVCSNAQIYGNAQVYGEAHVHDCARVYGDAEVFDEPIVRGYARIFGNAKVYGKAQVRDEAKVYGNAQVGGNIKIFGGDYSTGEFSCDRDLSKNNESYKVVQDFIYKVEDSNKLTTQTEYDSIDDFFSEPIANDVKLDTLIICTVDTKEPLINLQKVEVEDKTEFKFIVDITNEDDDDFRFRSVIKSQEQLCQLIQQTVDALKQYPKFSKYANDLEECL